MTLVLYNAEMDEMGLYIFNPAYAVGNSLDEALENGWEVVGTL